MLSENHYLACWYPGGCGGWFASMTSACKDQMTVINDQGKTRKNSPAEQTKSILPRAIVCDSAQFAL
jgi:hypothetical protein